MAIEQCPRCGHQAMTAGQCALCERHELSPEEAVNGTASMLGLSSPLETVLTIALAIIIGVVATMHYGPDPQENTSPLPTPSASASAAALTAR